MVVLLLAISAHEAAHAWMSYKFGDDTARLLGRITLNVWKKRCRIRQFILTLPLTIITLVVLVAGEWVGCLLGPGDALSKVE